MASTNPTFNFFTITQPFPGAPLQFQPALGSQELEELVDAYIIGSASKQDKLSEVTIEFFNHATVDINSGARFRQYNVALSPWGSQAFEQSPVQSESSGFSPPIFTPSPASSATFADSGYGSISLTPPMRNRGARVSKKPKKDAKKSAEIRLPGFSIMTKDGVDVTTSAGRGVKTKEQREHAHLMRIMKACDDCKKKKVRCDPSHRRQNTAMSRTSTSTTKASFSHSDPSPTVSVPSISREVTRHSPQSNMPPFGSNPIDDFVLFPEDTSSWNPADMPIPGIDSQDYDLGQFNFDINDIDLSFPTMNMDQSFDFSSYEHSNIQLDRSLDHDPFVADQYGLDQWASAQGDLTLSHSRPHPSISSQDSGQLHSSSSESGGIQGTNSSMYLGTSSFADDFWPDSPVDHPQISQASHTSQSISPTLDWSVIELSVNASSTQKDTSSSPAMNRKERRNRIRAVDRARNTAIQELVDLIPSRTSIELSELQDPIPAPYQSSFNSAPDPLWCSDGQSNSPKIFSGSLAEFYSLEKTGVLVEESLQAFKSAPAAYQPMYEELQRLRDAFSKLKSGHTDNSPVLQQPILSLLEILTSQLHVLLSHVKKVLRTSHLTHQRYNYLDPDFHLDYLQQCQVNARRLIRTLYATIPNLQQDAGSGGVFLAENPSSFSSGSNFSLISSPSESQNRDKQTHPQDAGVQMLDGSRLSWANSTSSTSHGRDNRYDVVLREEGPINILQFGENVYEAESGVPGSAYSGGPVAMTTVGKARRYFLAAKPDIERLSSFVDVEPRTVLQSGMPLLASSHQHSSPVDLPIEPSTLRFSQTELAPTSISFYEDLGKLSSACKRNYQDILEQSQQGNSSTVESLSSSDIVAQAAQLNTFFQRHTVNEALAHNMGGSQDVSLPQKSEIVCPDSISGTVVNNSAHYNAAGRATAQQGGFDKCVSYMLMLVSLFMLNYLQATTLILPLAALFLAIPRPTSATVATITLCCIAISQSSSSLPSLMDGLRSFVSLVLMSPSLLKKWASFYGGSLTPSPRTASSKTISEYKDPSLSGLFEELTVGPAI